MLRVLTLTACLAGPAAACETALVLAIDISGSIDRNEYRLQMQGLADALESPEIAETLVADRVELALVHWSGPIWHKMTLPWQQMRTRADVARFAEIARSMPRPFDSSDTSIGQALRFAATQFAAVPDCERKVIDVSGDGEENAGFTLKSALVEMQDLGITVNAIAIEEAGGISPITTYFRRFGITRDGFVVTAFGVDDYPRAIRLKLLRELAKLTS